MKRIYQLLMCAMLLSAVVSCKKDDDATDNRFLEPTYANVAGVWKLTKWNSLEQTNDPYMYVVLDRKERTFEIYQNMDSNKSRHATGKFTISIDKDDNYVIKGEYDFGSGIWSYDYFVSELTSTDMVWKATSAEDVTHYTRVDEVPTDIVNGTKSN